MKKIVLIVAIILVSVTSFFISPYPKQKISQISKESASDEITKVTYVVDGDTIEVEGGRRVRYIGVNTPEIAHVGIKPECFSSEAKDENVSLVNGKTVRLVSDVSDKDTYGRLLRYVYVGDEFVNDTLVRQGFAVAEPIKPDTLFASQFLSAQNEAKREYRGLWHTCFASVDTRQ